MFSKKSFFIFVTAVATTVATFNAYSNIPGQSFFNGDQKDKTQIVVSGRVSNLQNNSFELNYGKDSIAVKLEDWSFDDKSESVRDGERVTVYGYVEDSWFKKRALKAEAIYVQDRNTYFIAGNKNGYYVTAITIDKIPDNSQVSIRGKIVDIDGKNFTIKYGADTIKVNTKALGYNPLDEKSAKRVKVGDLIYVSGVLDSGFFEDKEIKADYIVKLRLFGK